MTEEMIRSWCSNHGCYTNCMYEGSDCLMRGLIKKNDSDRQVSTVENGGNADDKMLFRPSM